MKRPDKLQGFTLIELMIVIAIIAFLSIVSVPSLLRFLAKAKRTEAQVHLGSLYTAQKSYYAENNSYSTQLAGPKSVGWKPEGYTNGGPQERFNYTYGFAQGPEGVSHFTGKLQTPASALGSTFANNIGFIAAAAGDIDNDGKPDVLTVNELHDIIIVQDDLE